MTREPVVRSGDIVDQTIFDLLIDEGWLAQMGPEATHQWFWTPFALNMLDAARKAADTRLRGNPAERMDIDCVPNALMRQKLTAPPMPLTPLGAAPQSTLEEKEPAPDTPRTDGLDLLIGQLETLTAEEESTVLLNLLAAWPSDEDEAAIGAFWAHLTAHTGLEGLTVTGEEFHEVLGRWPESVEQLKAFATQVGLTAADRIRIGWRDTLAAATDYFEQPRASKGANIE